MTLDITTSHAVPGYHDRDSGLTDRERFNALLAYGPILPADAIVCLCGEDAESRLEIGAQLLRSGAAPVILLSGARHEPPRHVGSHRCHGLLMGMGIASDKIEVETISMNTKEQAIQVTTRAYEREWKRLLLVASPYHLPRAVLTFVAWLIDKELDRLIQLMPIPASQTAWHQSPPGTSLTRLDLYDVEAKKIALYQAQGDVASYADGLNYLLRWEQESK